MSGCKAINFDLLVWMAGWGRGGGGNRCLLRFIKALEHLAVCFPIADCLTRGKVLLFGPVLLSACTSLPLKETPYAVKLVDLPLIHFEGKGAAAGVMMSSSMGPMGIAIGVAIDEGIAKDIRGALDRVGCTVDGVAENAFQAVSRNYGVNVVPTSSSSESRVDVLVQVNQVKFRALPSERDLTVVEVALTIEKAGVMSELMSARAGDAALNIPLNELRTDGDKACDLLQAEVTGLFDAWYQQQ